MIPVCAPGWDNCCGFLRAYCTALVFEAEVFDRRIPHEEIGHDSELCGPNAVHITVARVTERLAKLSSVVCSDNHLGVTQTAGSVSF